MQGSGTIYGIEKRKNEGGNNLAIANVDVTLLTFSLSQPPLEEKQLTRFLVAFEYARVPFHLVFNKKDLIEEERVEEWREKMRRWGYDPKFVSVATGDGIDEIVKVIGSGKTVALAGPSGVGKSSLINRLRATSALESALSVEKRQQNDYDEDRNRKDSSEEGEEGKITFVTDLDVEGRRRETKERLEIGGKRKSTRNFRSGRFAIGETSIVSKWERETHDSTR